MLLSNISLLEASIQGFLNSDTYLQFCHIREWILYKNLKLAELKPKDQSSVELKYVVEILFPGEYPFCGSLYLRNICIQKNTRGCLVAIFKEYFPMVSDVWSIHSTNNNLCRYGSEMGLTITPAF